MEVKTVTKYRDDGSVKFKESAMVFNVEDKGNGIATAQLSFSRMPNQNSKQDQALIAAGLKLDQKGYMHGTIFVSFRGPAYQKSLALRNGSVIQDITFDIDVYPYLSKDNQITYRNGLYNYAVIDFEVKNVGAAVQAAQQPTQQPAQPGYPMSPMYTQTAPAAVQQPSEPEYEY